MKRKTREEAKEMIYNTNGKIFGVKFTKKNGEERTMNCRRGVQKGVKGVGLAYDTEKFNLINVFDMAKDGYRMINTSTINELTISGKTHIVK